MRCIFLALCFLVGCISETNKSEINYSTTQPINYFAKESVLIDNMRDSVVVIHHKMKQTFVSGSKLENIYDDWVGSGVVIHYDGKYSYILSIDHIIGNLPTTASRSIIGNIGLQTGLMTHEFYVGINDLNLTRDELPTRMKAEIIAKSEYLDISLFKAEFRPAKITRLKDITLPAVGSKIYAIGYPADNGLKITQGIISQYRSSDEDAILKIWVTTPIFGGNSGGGIFTESGDLIGIVQRSRNPVESSAISVTDIVYWLHSINQDFLIKKAD